MENLDFTDLSSNEALDLLATHTRWLAEQYKLAMQALPPEVVVAAFQSGDPQKTFFINSGNTHLPVMAAATESMKTSSSAPTMEILPPMQIPTVEPEDENGVDPSLNVQ